MANNNPGGIKSFLQDVGETVTEPVRDEFQRAVEEGTSQVTGRDPNSQAPANQQTPQNLQNNPQYQQRQQQDQKNLQNVRQFIQQMQNQEQQSKNKNIMDQQKVQKEEKEEEEKKQIKHFEVQKKRQELSDIQVKQRQVEIKKGGF